MPYLTNISSHLEGPLAVITRKPAKVLQGEKLNKIKTILLVQPREATPDGSFALPTRYPGTLFTLGTVLMQKFSGVKVIIADLALPNINLKEILQSARPDLLGISFFSPQYDMAKEIVTTARDFCGRGIKIVGGGVHATAQPKETMQKIDFDFLVTGEGEEAFPQLISCLDQRIVPNKLKSICYRNAQGTPIINERGPRIINLDQYPLGVEILPVGYLDQYAPVKMVEREGTLGPIFTSRGCMHTCSNCGTNVIFPRFGNRKVVWRSPGRVIEEIRILHERHGIEVIRFQDDDFTGNKPRDLAIAEKIKSTGLNHLEYSYLAIARPNISRNIDFYHSLVNAGFSGVSLGVESGDLGLLQKLGMKTDGILHGQENIKIMREAGLQSIKTFWMFGLPGQNQESIKLSKHLLSELMPDSIGVAAAQPYPGSRLAEFGLKMHNYHYSNMVHEFPVSVREKKKAFLPGTYTKEMTSAEIAEAMRSFVNYFNSLK